MKTLNDLYTALKPSAISRLQQMVLAPKSVFINAAQVIDASITLNTTPEALRSKLLGDRRLANADDDLRRHDADLSFRVCV